MNLKFRLSLMNFLEFAVWGAYLTCMGNYAMLLSATFSFHTKIQYNKYAIIDIIVLPLQFNTYRKIWPKTTESIPQ